MSRRTIIMLSAKRCGSTAMFQMFRAHPEVGVCHVDKSIDNWEPNFWNLGYQAIQGSPEKFIARFEKSHPFLVLPKSFTDESVFELWDAILEELGPVVFDKSPQYLGNTGAMELLKRYVDRGNDVRFFAFIRDPRDAITSQYELWKSYVENDSPKTRERAWLEKYRHLEYLQKHSFYVPLFRYEDFSAAPSCYAPIVLAHCGCTDVPEAYAHIKPTSVGRYSASILPSIRRWRFSDEFVGHLRKYGYRIPQLPFFGRAKVVAAMLADNVKRELESRRAKADKAPTSPSA